MGERQLDNYPDSYQYSAEKILKDAELRTPIKYTGVDRNRWALVGFAQGLVYEQHEQLNRLDINRILGYYKETTSKDAPSLADAIELTLTCFYSLFPKSIDQPVNKTGAGYNHNLSENIVSSTSSFEESSSTKVDVIEIMKQGEKHITRNQYNILVQRYFNDKNQTEIARERGVTNTSIGLTEKKALKKLQSLTKPYFVDND